MEFLGREKELTVLEEECLNTASLVVISGRRRVGKTALIKRFIQGKESLYYEIGEERSTGILTEFSIRVASAIGSRASSYGSWKDAILEYIESSPAKKIIVIDEFQYLMLSEPGTLKHLQELWDEVLIKKDIMLILCGSYLSVMGNICKDYNSPLYGRCTKSIRLMPLSFHEAYGEREDHRRAVMEYAITGGVPYYMGMIRQNLTPEKNFENMAMNMYSPLADEPSYIFKGELKDSSGYGYFIRSVALGNRKLGDIAASSNRKKSDVTPVLQKLQDIGALVRKTPITAGPESRKGRFEVTDNFTIMWYLFVYPYRTDIALGQPEPAIDNFRMHFIDSHVSFVFEEVCLQVLREHLNGRGINARCGRYWGDGIEIDVVAMDEKGKTIYAGECMFINSPVDHHMLASLMSKCGNVPEFDGYRIKYCIFSVSGYTEKMVNMAKAVNAVLFDQGRVLPSNGFEYPAMKTGESEFGRHRPTLWNHQTDFFLCI